MRDERRKRLGVLGIALLAALWLAALWLAALWLAAPGWAVSAQGPTPFFYGYIDGPNGNELDTLHLVDPGQPEAEPRAIPLPIPDGNYLVAAEASPTGEWLYLLSTTRQMGVLQLFNPSTLETRSLLNFPAIDIYHSTVDQIPRWSPDGQYLAVIGDYGLAGAFLYSVNEAELLELYEGWPIGEEGPWIEPRKLAWRPDGASIALYTGGCTSSGPRECVYMLLVLSVPDCAVISTTTTSLQGSRTSDLVLSPDGSRAVFQHETGPSIGTIGAEFSDVFVWNLDSQTLTQVTHFSNPLPLQLDTRLVAFVNEYAMHWLDADRLLLSYYTEGYTWSDPPIQPGSFRFQTDTVTFPDEMFTPLFPDFVEEWASNPVTDEVAFVSTVYALDEIDAPQFQSRQVGLGTFDGQALHDVITLADGYGLQWSPEGDYLVYRYLEEETHARFPSSGLIFVNRLGETLRLVPSFPYSIKTVGWLAIDGWPTGDAAE